MTHADTHNILYPLQHGFRRSRSCETQLLEFVDDVSKNIEKSTQTDILIMDFSKAFDKVSHNLLIHKLNYYGIQGKTNRWINSFFKIPHSSCCSRGGDLRLCPCSVRCAPGLDTGSQSVFILHKRHSSLP